jgi:excisionase family DNA binding protein
MGQQTGDEMGGTSDVRIGEAAEMLGVSVESLRRWERDGRLKATRTIGGQRRVPVGEVRRLMTAEAVSELGLRVGDEAVCVVKATNVIVEVPSPVDRRRT